MKNLILTSTILVGLSLVSCTSNQDLASLSEYDDVYYRSGDAVDAGKAPSSTEQAAAVMPGASSAEQSYYQNTPYAPSEPAQTQVAPNDDYYDADYARRVQNFHQNPDGNYNYGNSANSSYSSGPNVNVGMGYGNYGGNSSWGTSVGINYSSNMYNSYYTSPMYFNMVLGRYNYSNPWIYQSGFYYDRSMNARYLSH